MMIDRRQTFLGLGAVALAAIASPSAAAAGGEVYDYLFLDFEAAGSLSAKGLAAWLKTEPLPGGGEVVGLFTPQLGWRSRQAALLIRWPADGPDRETATAWIQSGPRVAGVTHERLTPTVRPAPGNSPSSGGIHVHRWFVVDTANVPEFVALSVEGWRDFEVRFDAQIFGLWHADQNVEDQHQGMTRLLLITRYRDHGVWQDSRDPSTEAMASFARRQRLTRESWAASTVLAE